MGIGDKLLEKNQSKEFMSKIGNLPKVNRLTKSKIKDKIKDYIRQGTRVNDIVSLLRENDGISKSKSTIERYLREIYDEYEKQYGEDSRRRLHEDVEYLYDKRNNCKEHKDINGYQKTINKMLGNIAPTKQEIDISGDINVIYLDQQDESL